MTQFQLSLWATLSDQPMSLIEFSNMSATFGLGSTARIFPLGPAASAITIVNNPDALAPRSKAENLQDLSNPSGEISILGSKGNKTTSADHSLEDQL